MKVVKFNDPSDLTKVFDDFFNTGIDRIKRIPVPSVNISEDDKEYVIEVAAPGKEKADFKVNLDNNVLTISSEIQKEKEEKPKHKKDRNYIHQEYSYSSFERSFNLSDDIDQDSIEAKYEKGVLHVILPKKEVAVNKNKEIAIS
ncbi:MAG: Hsp20/alpha crystallin family protein [Bacteroidales bacterium]|jgi:HSP20 family protein|nr:Hsp20/alpha crystallin family protein [Bacteroidales bacterium]